MTYTSLIIEAGASVREDMTAARHVTPGLTLGVYAKARNSRLQELAEKVVGAVLDAPGSHTEATRKAAGAESLTLSNGSVVGEVGFEPTRGRTLSGF